MWRLASRYRRKALRAPLHRRRQLGQHVLTAQLAVRIAAGVHVALLAHVIAIDDKIGEAERCAVYLVIGERCADLRRRPHAEGALLLVAVAAGGGADVSLRRRPGVCVLNKGTVSRDGYFCWRSKYLNQYFLCMRWCFQGLSKAFRYPIQLFTFYLLFWIYLRYLFWKCLVKPSSEFPSLWPIDVLKCRLRIGCRENAED